MRKICFITGTRAEYGLLSRLMKMVKDDAKTALQIIATNMHLMPEYGETYKEIEADGFTIDYKVPMQAKSDDAYGVVHSMSEEMSGMADAYKVLRPDLIVILGDRYEMLIAASVALMFKIPIAHLHGGEITEGAFDDSIRHAITKLSHLHFTSTEDYRKRVIQMGESPNRVFNVGALGVENAKMVPLMNKDEVESSLGFNIDNNTLLATYHPVTLATESIETQIEAFLEALDERKNLRIIFTMPNSDTGGQLMAQKIDDFVSRNSDRAIAFKSLGMRRYLSALSHVAAVIGNSSSGLIEVPSFGIPTLDIGDRQKGRMACDSVFHCPSNKNSIEEGLTYVLSEEAKQRARKAKNPYEKENTASTIFSTIANYPLEEILQKHFYDL